MSKETIFKIREAELEAERILAEADAEAARMRAEAEEKGRRLCEETERQVTAELAAVTEQLHQRGQEHIARALEEGQAEADALTDGVRFTRRSAEKLVIRGLEAKCR